jgi:peptide/nickel transport system permease protein
MAAYLRYLSTRAVLWLVTMFISATVVFIVPHLVPGNPLSSVFSRLAAVGGSLNARELIEQYTKMFGLDRPLWQQYLSFLAQLARGNLGYSISSFPSHVSDVVLPSIPWTIGLLSVTTIFSWVLGSVIGAVVGWSGGRSPLFQALVPVALVLYTVPYYIVALILVFLFAFRWQIFPLSGAYSVGLRPELSLTFALDVLHHATLPALSIIVVSLGWWFLSMRSLITTQKGEDYILLAEATGLPDRHILWRYAFRNALLPQATGLALSLGHIVGGAIITEVIFSYPGLGWVIYNAIKSLDFPVIQGSVLLLVVAVATTNFIIDLAYPLIDPRIRQAGRE